MWNLVAYAIVKERVESWDPALWSMSVFILLYGHYSHMDKMPPSLETTVAMSTPPQCCIVQVCVIQTYDMLFHAFFILSDRCCINALSCLFHPL